MNEIILFAKFLAQETDATEISNFIMEMLTDSEIETLTKRWRILEMLSNKYSQREISKELGVSLCKVTRGSQILKNKNSTVAKYLNKGIVNG